MTLLGIRSRTQLTERVLASASELQAVGAFCIGTNQIDLDAAARLGIACFNAPYSNTRSVVELALAEIVALARHLTDKNKQMHEGIWDKSAGGAHEVRGRTGLVGYATSGRSCAAESFGMRVCLRRGGQAGHGNASVSTARRTAGHLRNHQRPRRRPAGEHEPLR